MLRGGGQLHDALSPNTGISKTLNAMSEVMSIVEVTPKYLVRKLTPTECARLQGFPDWWCSDIKHSDTVEYKMWGNGVALPCVLYVMEGIVSYMEQQND